MKKLTIVKGNITQKSGESLTIFDAEKSILYTFNPTATYIFEKLKKNITIRKIIGGIVKEYGIPEKNAMQDVEQLIAYLLSKKLATEENIA